MSVPPTTPSIAPEQAPGEELARALRSLESRLDTVARPYEEALANRLVSSACDRLFGYLKLGFWIVSVIFSIVGIGGVTSYIFSLDKVKKAAIESLPAKVDAFINGEDGRLLVAETTQTAVTTAVAAAKADAQTKHQEALATFQSQLNGSKQEFDKQMDEMLSSGRLTQQDIREGMQKLADENRLLREVLVKTTQDFNTQLAALATKAEVVVAPVKIAQVKTEKLSQDGFCYFGLVDKQKKWSDTYFSRVDGKSVSSQPTGGEVYLTTARVFVRSSPPTYTRDSATLGAAVGVLEKGTSVRIEKVEMKDRGSEGSRCWVQIATDSELLPP